MPDGKTHRNVGTIAGAGFAAFKARNLATVPLLIETTAGALLGRWAAALPDKIDPPTSPNHRGLGHSIIGTGALVDYLARNLDPWQFLLRQRAEEYAQLRDETKDPLAWFWYGLLWLLCHLALGGLAGIAAAFPSHIVLDAFTTKGVPLVA